LGGSCGGAWPPTIAPISHSLRTRTASFAIILDLPPIVGRPPASRPSPAAGSSTRYNAKSWTEMAKKNSFQQGPESGSARTPWTADRNRLLALSKTPGAAPERGRRRRARRSSARGVRLSACVGDGWVIASAARAQRVTRAAGVVSAASLDVAALRKVLATDNVRHLLRFQVPNGRFVQT
jgi:hypothetical protein